eukprot:1126115-Pelagomonas_calceolata.AAC.2
MPCSEVPSQVLLTCACTPSQSELDRLPPFSQVGQCVQHFAMQLDATCASHTWRFLVGTLSLTLFDRGLYAISTVRCQGSRGKATLMTMPAYALLQFSSP